MTIDFRPDWLKGLRGLQHRLFRWPLINILDRLYPDACWAELCMWSFFYRELPCTLSDSLLPDTDCMKGRSTPGGCWCGKMRSKP